MAATRNAFKNQVFMVELILENHFAVEKLFFFFD